jgi:IS30 family transposase
METFNLPRISHETIYQHILQDKYEGGYLYKHLRQSNKKRKKRYGSNSKRGQIKNRISIAERPSVVDAKARIGDWEIDTVIGKHQQGVLITLVERISKFTLIKQVANKTAEAVTARVISILKNIKHKVLTITADNSKEFAYHKQISMALKLDFYFAHPYHSWERGLNENTNGLIRQYFPKKTSFDSINDNDVETAMERLNSRPRKTLGFKTPNNIFLDNQSVALNT